MRLCVHMQCAQTCKHKSIIVNGIIRSAKSDDQEHLREKMERPSGL